MNRNIRHLHAGFLNILTQSGFDSLQTNPLINDGVVVSNHVVIDHDTVGVNVAPTASINSVTFHPIPMKSAVWKECVIIIPDAKSKGGSNIASLIIKASTGHIMRSGRQRSPATVSIVITPGYPCRSPGPSGSPYPAIAGMTSPASVVKGSPSPGVIRIPIPAVVGINPPSIVAVRSPVGTDTSNCRPPAPADLIDVHPVPIRTQRFIKFQSRSGNLICGFIHWLQRFRFCNCHLLIGNQLRYRFLRLF